MDTRTIRLGVNRGKPRLWLEGAWLAELGFVRGARIDSVLTGHTPETATGLKIVLDPSGLRRVSGKLKKDGTQHPIIDMNGAELSPLAGVPLTLTATYGLLTIHKA